MLGIGHHPHVLDDALVNRRAVADAWAEVFRPGGAGITASRDPQPGLASR